jgi:uncharacterized protein YecT (DUF1311 family)
MGLMARSAQMLANTPTMAEGGFADLNPRPGSACCPGQDAAAGDRKLNRAVRKVLQGEW